MHSKFFNRPISPHLTIYKPQASSLSSIWHRISAVFIIGYVLGIIFALNLYFWVLLSKSNYLYAVVYIVGNSPLIKFYLFFIASYHMLNGLRHIKWNLGYILINSKQKNSIFTFWCFLLLIQSLNFF